MAFAWLELECQRSACDASEQVELDAGHWNESLERVVAENAPGWGWDTAGLEDVLHCPEHRTRAAG